MVREDEGEREGMSDREKEKGEGKDRREGCQGGGGVGTCIVHCR